MTKVAMMAVMIVVAPQLALAVDSPDLNRIKAGDVAVLRAAHMVMPGVPAVVKGVGFESAIARPLLIAKMQANTLKTIALVLKGLEQQNSPKKAPAEYTSGVEDASLDISEALLDMDAAIKEKDSAALSQAAVRMAPMVERLKKLSKSIEGNVEYSCWGGSEINKIAATLDINVNEIRRNAPFAF